VSPSLQLSLHWNGDIEAKAGKSWLFISGLDLNKVPGIYLLYFHNILLCDT